MPLLSQFSDQKLSNALKPIRSYMKLLLLFKSVFSHNDVLGPEFRDSYFQAWTKPRDSHFLFSQYVLKGSIPKYWIIQSYCRRNDSFIHICDPCYYVFPLTKIWKSSWKIMSLPMSQISLDSHAKYSFNFTVVCD